MPGGSLGRLRCEFPSAIRYLVLTCIDLVGIVLFCVLILLALFDISLHFFTSSPMHNHKSLYDNTQEYATISAPNGPPFSSSNTTTHPKNGHLSKSHYTIHEHQHHTIKMNTMK